MTLKLKMVRKVQGIHLPNLVRLLEVLNSTTTSLLISVKEVSSPKVYQVMKNDRHRLRWPDSSLSHSLKVHLHFSRRRLVQAKAWPTSYPLCAPVKWPLSALPIRRCKSNSFIKTFLLCSSTSNILRRHW